MGKYTKKAESKTGEVSVINILLSLIYMPASLFISSKAQQAIGLMSWLLRLSRNFKNRKSSVTLFILSISTKNCPSPAACMRWATPKSCRRMIQWRWAPITINFKTLENDSKLKSDTQMLGVNMTKTYSKTFENS
jgi:hypothetical protein